MKSKYVMDASALLSLINQETGYQKISQYLPEVASTLFNLSISAQEIRFEA